MQKANLIQLENVTKVFDGDEALKNISLGIRPREFVTLLGPSGCGKTTMLRIIAGFEKPSSGQVFFEGSNITSTPPYKRRVNTVFQKYALFPHLNVFENVAFGLKIKKADKQQIKTKVTRMLELVGLAGFEKRWVDSLSGGEQQRIAIARALVNEPEVLLLDEPLGALDLKLRKEMQIELKNIQKRLGITFLYVTHDQEEALTMSDTVVVMRDGEIQQIGTPVDIYNEPKNAYVADFIGESNIVPGTMLRDFHVHFCGQDFSCVDKGFAHDQKVHVVVRPEDIQIVPPQEGMITGEVVSILFMGVHYEIMVKSLQNGGFVWTIHSTDKSSIGDRVGLVIDPDDIHIMEYSDYDPKARPNGGDHEE